MRYLDKRQALALHGKMLRQTGGLDGLRDAGALESALAQPKMTFGGADLYPDLVDKAAALGFSLISNHPFVDGNKRTGQIAMEMFLGANGYEIDASVAAQEGIVLQVASGELSREEFTTWLRDRVVPIRPVD
jgi:death-on-curing protein